MALSGEHGDLQVVLTSPAEGRHKPIPGGSAAAFPGRKRPQQEMSAPLTYRIVSLPNAPRFHLVYHRDPPEPDQCTR